MVVKVREKLKRLDMSKVIVNLKNIFHEEKEIQDILLEFYLY